MAEALRKQTMQMQAEINQLKRRVKEGRETQMNGIDIDTGVLVMDLDEIQGVLEGRGSTHDSTDAWQAVMSFGLTPMGAAIKQRAVLVMGLLQNLQKQRTAAPVAEYIDSYGASQSARGAPGRDCDKP